WAFRNSPAPGAATAFSKLKRPARKPAPAHGQELLQPSLQVRHGSSEENVQGASGDIAALDDMREAPSVRHLGQGASPERNAVGPFLLWRVGLERLPRSRRGGAQVLVVIEVLDPVVHLARKQDDIPI